jgi:murein DD-endopeptidase
MSQLKFLLVPLLLVLTACGSAPRVSDRHPEAVTRVGASLVHEAARYVGVPYVYGGTSPRGFDCSGLVFYAHERAGLHIPRTAAAQHRAARAIELRSLAPGDLIFFRIKGRAIDHVGMYVGNGRFVHAPRTGRVVSYAYLDDPYYRKRLQGAGRFW